MKISKIILMCMAVLGLCTHKIMAQDTLKINIEQAESRFLERNLQLLAERYSISIADAEIIQAKLLNNPSLSIGDVNFWNPNASNELDISPDSFGNRVVFSLQLEQMIRTAGKRKKLVDVAKVSKEMAVQEFEAFLLTLKTELRTNLHEVIYQQSCLDAIRMLQESVNNLLQVYKNQALAGNIAKSELIRLQSSLIELETEANELRSELNRQYKNIKILLNITDKMEILLLSSDEKMKNPDEISLENLLETAKNSRPEFLLSDLRVQYNEKLLRYEKSQRSPDVRVSVNYDRYGGVWKNFVGLGVGVDIPIFNRNQGNIKIAKLKIEQSSYHAENLKNTISQEVTEIYNNYKMNYNFYQKLVDTDFSDDLENMFDTYSRNLLNKNTNMLEYIDFMYAYKTTKQAILIAKKNLDTSFAELQFSINNKIE